MKNKKKLKVGITCYPTFGGSGVVASEIGHYLARNGHQVHFIATDVPSRVMPCLQNIFFHEVQGLKYPLFTESLYTLTLASKMIEVAKLEKLDVLHVHYAVPHAVSAYLAKEALGKNAPKIITTLHGTDITLVGSDPSYLGVTKLAIERSDTVTAVSNYLRNATYKNFSIKKNVKINVIPNFVDLSFFKASATRDHQFLKPFLKSHRIKSPKKYLVHISNFRPVKRVKDTVLILEKVRKQIDAVLILIGDGPDRLAVESYVRERKLENSVIFLGKVRNFVNILQNADLLLLPSQEESFGLVALEAMACGMPVVASDIGGIPEVVINNKTGFLEEVGDIKNMSTRVMQLLSDEDKYKQFSINSADLVIKKFSADKVVRNYLELYYK